MMKIIFLLTVAVLVAADVTDLSEEISVAASSSVLSTVTHLKSKLTCLTNQLKVLKVCERMLHKAQGCVQGELTNKSHHSLSTHTLAYLAKPSCTAPFKWLDGGSTGGSSRQKKLTGDIFLLCYYHLQNQVSRSTKTARMPS